MTFTVNVLISTFPGLSLPSTLCLPLPSSLTSYDLSHIISNLLPQGAIDHLILSSIGNRRINTSKTITLENLAACSAPVDPRGSRMLSLRLSALLVGGKGGFGSQLRAAGGRMSSRKRKQNAALATGSARNLDGRRLRTITEAKNLATYLATKPEMDRKEKEERRKRWEQIIELAEQREADMRAGKTADGRRKGLSEEWLQEKEEVGDSVKNAVKIAMTAESQLADHSGSEESGSGSADDDSDNEEPMELDEEEMTRLRQEAEEGDTDAIWVLKNKLKIPSLYLPKAKLKQRTFAGFDDDLSSDEDEGQADADSPGTSKRKSVVRNQSSSRSSP